jgi:hypothetical protein
LAPAISSIDPVEVIESTLWIDPNLSAEIGPRFFFTAASTTDAKFDSLGGLLLCLGGSSITDFVGSLLCGADAEGPVKGRDLKAEVVVAAVLRSSIDGYDTGKIGTKSLKSGSGPSDVGCGSFREELFVRGLIAATPYANSRLLLAANRLCETTRALCGGRREPSLPLPVEQ